MWEIRARLKRLVESAVEFKCLLPHLRPYINLEQYIYLLESTIKFLHKPSIYNLKTEFVKEGGLHIPPGRVLQLPKEITGASHKLSILQDLSGKMILLLECKSKLVGGIKDNTNKYEREGRSKRGKVAIRLDIAKEEKWINLSPRLEEEFDPNSKTESALKAQRRHKSDIRHLIEEAEFSHKLPSQFLKYLYTEKFISKGYLKVSLYTPLAECDLGDYIYDNKISLIDKHHLAKQLLEQLVALHDIELLHGDIKRANILVFKDKTIKLADYGLMMEVAKAHEQDATPTWRYESPEVSFVHRLFNNSHAEYYTDEEDDDGIVLTSYAKELINQDKKLKRLLRESSDYDLKSYEHYLVPHKANDVFAMGMVLYRLYFGDYPGVNCSETTHNLNLNPVIRGMLMPRRENRFSAKEALLMHNAYSGYFTPEVKSLIPQFEQMSRRRKGVVESRPTSPELGSESEVEDETQNTPGCKMM